jgi:hypothetical protein
MSIPSETEAGKRDGDGEGWPEEDVQGEGCSAATAESSVAGLPLPAHAW